MIRGDTIPLKSILGTNVPTPQAQWAAQKNELSHTIYQ